MRRDETSVGRLQWYGHVMRMDETSVGRLQWYGHVMRMDETSVGRLQWYGMRMDETSVGRLQWYGHVMRMDETSVGRLQWYGHVMRMDETYVGKRVMQMEVPGGRTRGRTKKRRWMDVVGEDLRDKQLSEDDVSDRTRWRRRAVRNIDPHIGVGRDAEKEE
ncbi:uncharacterized protein [Macrobrachium rosenbergii]|uniref:uncharacterized protein n=1 Tax=Macrobrachium rosenbergii TaxID=79674 RepID=UPI0034D62436